MKRTPWIVAVNLANHFAALDPFGGEADDKKPPAPPPPRAPKNGAIFLTPPE